MTAWQPTLVLPGESHGQRRLVGYSPQDCNKDLDTTEATECAPTHVEHWVCEDEWDFPGGTCGKGPAYQCRRCNRLQFDPWIGKIPLEDEMGT